MMNIQVSNLGSNITEESLHAAFSTYGKVLRAELMYDQFTGAARGFAYVEMDNVEDGDKAVSLLNGAIVDGKVLSVKRSFDRIMNRGSYPVRSRRGV